jgi:hypothetical protein
MDLTKFDRYDAGEPFFAVGAEVTKDGRRRKKEGGRRKKEEGRRRKEERRKLEGGGGRILRSIRANLEHLLGVF